MSLGVDILTLVASHITDSHIIANFCRISRTHLTAAGRGGINNIKGESISASLLIHLRTVASLDVDHVVLDDESVLTKLLMWVFPPGAGIRCINIKMKDKIWNISSLNEGVEFAAAMGNMASVEFLADAGANDWNRSMGYAAEGGHRALVDFFIGKGANAWEWGMADAARGGHRALVDFFIGKGAKFWNWGMTEAASGGHRDLVDFFIGKGAQMFKMAMAKAASGGHRDLVDLFISKGADNWGECMVRAQDHRDLYDFFHDKLYQPGRVRARDDCGQRQVVGYVPRGGRRASSGRMFN